MRLLGELASTTMTNQWEKARSHYGDQIYTRKQLSDTARSWYRDRMLIEAVWGASEKIPAWILSK